MKIREGLTHRSVIEHRVFDNDPKLKVEIPKVSPVLNENEWRSSNVCNDLFHFEYLKEISDTSSLPYKQTNHTKDSGIVTVLKSHTLLASIEHRLDNDGQGEFNSGFFAQFCQLVTEVSKACDIPFHDFGMAKFVKVNGLTYESGAFDLSYHAFPHTRFTLFFNEPLEGEGIMELHTGEGVIEVEPKTGKLVITDGSIGVNFRGHPSSTARRLEWTTTNYPWMMLVDWGYDETES